MKTTQRGFEKDLRLGVCDLRACSVENGPSPPMPSCPAFTKGHGEGRETLLGSGPGLQGHESVPEPTLRNMSSVSPQLRGDNGQSA